MTSYKKLFLLFCLFPLLCPAQQVEQYVKNIDVFNSYFPQEKVYLHFDNTGYFIGERIWFKAYVLRCDRGTLSDMSRVLYVELVTPGGEVIQTQKLKVVNGEADGHIELKDLLISGFYEVRAYTRYMLNWDSSALFSRVFPIFDKPAEDGDYQNRTLDTFSYKHRLPDYRTDSLPESRQFNLKFYPEGGALVSGLTSRVAYEITDERGAPCTLQGLFIDAGGQKTVLRPNSDGRGVFSCTPSARPAEAVFTDRQGKTFSFPLPKAESEGCVLTLSQRHAEYLVAQVSVSEAYRGQTLGLVMTNQGSVIAFDEMRLTGKELIRQFRRSDIPAGVSQLSVIDSMGQVLADRCFFIHPRQQQDSIQATIDSQSGSAGQIRLTLKTKPGAHFSLSVTDRDAMTGGSRGNALSWMLLSSDLKGFVNHPDTYLESDDEVHREAADLLMMVQGWRRYDLTMMAGRKPFEKRQPVEQGLNLFGTLRPMNKKKSVGDVELRATLYNRDGQVLRGTTRTAADGSYAFDLPDCDGEWTLLLNTAREGQAADYYVGIDRNFSPVTRPMSFAETQESPLKYVERQPISTLLPLSTDTIAFTQGSRMLKPVTAKGHYRAYDNAKARRSTEKRAQYFSTLFYNIDRATDEIADAGKPLPTLYEWLLQKNTFFKGSASQMLEAKPTPTDAYLQGYRRTPPADNSPSETERIKGEEYNGTTKEQSQIPPELDNPNKKRDNDLWFLNPLTFSDKGFHEALLIDHRLLFQLSGLSYKRRPIVWVIDNDFYALSFCSPQIKVEDLDLTTSTHYEYLGEMEKVKSVYVSENPTAWRRFLHCNKLEGKDPITVFLYTHIHQNTEHKGLRQTHFQGFATPQTYASPNYSVMPRLADYRRTLYWNPSVCTDNEGHAKVEFYNNATCKHLHLSAEGITREGDILLLKQ